MQTIMRSFRLAILAAMAAAVLIAEDNAISRQQGDDMLSELRQIRQLLRESLTHPPGANAQGGRVTNVTLKLDDSRWIGSKEAPFSLVEFTDYQCPFCARFHATTFSEIKEKYIDTGMLRFYAR